MITLHIGFIFIKRRSQYISITKEICDNFNTATTTTTTNATSASTGTAPQFIPQSQNHNLSVDKKKKKETEITPPYSKLFIVCDKEITEDEIEKSFNRFGRIEYCRMIKEKKNDPSSSSVKSMCYIKYDKTSSAAEAMEEMNGKPLTNSHHHSSPIKIQIAEHKNAKKKVYSKDPEDTPARSRLFVVCPKEMSEETLNERFRDFPDLEYCKVITDKVNGDSKGFAYVKFSKASSAAKAMEEILVSGLISGMRVKILIADPKQKRIDNNNPLMYLSSESSPNSSLYHPSSSPPYYILPYPAPHDPHHPHHMTYHPPHHPHPMSFPVSHVLEISSKQFIPEDQINDLLSHYPGFEYNEFLSSDDTNIAMKVHSEFQNADVAIIAQYSLNGLEFPPGNYLSCTFAPPIYADYPVPVYPQNMYYPYPVYPPSFEGAYANYYEQTNNNDHMQYRQNSKSTNNDPNLLIPNHYQWAPWGFSTSPPSDYRY